MFKSLFRNKKQKKAILMTVEDDGFVNIFLDGLTGEEACKYMLQGAAEIEHQELSRELT